MATRRKVLALGLTPLAGQGRRFFTEEELRLVEELTEMVIPMDGHSGGAKAAGVAAFVDGALAEEFTDEKRLEWRRGLRLVDQVTRRRCGKGFVEASAADREAVMGLMAKNEFEPKTQLERFFAELKGRTVWAYYTSKVGIHEELEYKGNVVLREFVGIDVSRG